MFTEVMIDALNDQINNELYSAYLYLAMSAYCERQHFAGCAHWLRVQNEEETAHGMRLYDFMIARTEKVKLKAISEPPVDFDSIPAVFETVLQHEQQVTRQIESLYELAFQEKAFSALVELEWFVTEQVEEEKTAGDIVHKFNLVKDDSAALIDLDRELGARTRAGGGNGGGA